MNWLDDLFRFLESIVTSEQVAHTIKHMGLHAFNHFLQHKAPHLWAVVSDKIGEVFQFVLEWLSDNF
jgi:hypothetical protein